MSIQQRLTQPSTSSNNQNFMPQSSTNLTNTRTAQNEYIDAINFTEDSPLDSVDNEPSPSKLKTMMKDMMKNVNNSKYLYPAIAIAVMVVFVIMIAFQKTTTFTKIMAALVLVIFVVFTIYYAKQ